MRGKRADTLLHTMLFVELFTVTPATKDLTDEEYFWEPASPCWSVRRAGEVRTPGHLGAGEWVMEYDDAIGSAPAGSTVHPLTSIAWNLAHVAPIPGRLCELDVFGGSDPVGGEPSSDPAPATAAAAADLLLSGWRRLDAFLHDCPDETLERTWTWAFGETSGYQHVALMLNEVSHHCSQVCELRDLRRALAAG